jgi:hypothetical protein
MYQGITVINPKINMKTSVLYTLALVTAMSVSAADSKPDLEKAIKELAGKANYSWKSTVTVPEGNRFRMGPTEGQINKEGLTHVSMTMGTNKTEMVLQGTKAAILTQDGDWKSAEELSNTQGRGQFAGMMARNFKSPTTQAAELVGFTKELKKDGEVYSGDLSEDGAKQLLTFRRGADTDGPTITDSKGNAKFWVKDGMLSKYEFHIEGKMSFNGNDREVNRTTTIEIKDVGTTKVQVPEDARKKLS